MKRILVMDVPAENGGALTILNDFHKRALLDRNTMWYFITSVVNLDEGDNVNVIKFPWVKKSWLHRLYFDYFVAPKLVKKFDIDEVFSLDNTTVARTKIPQVVYIHQAIPFVDINFDIVNETKYWLYQKIIGRRIIKSIYKAKSIIVQTNWMKNAIVDKTNINSEKIIIDTPKLDIKVKKKFTYSSSNNRTFFYPAGAMPYKNHMTIINAVRHLIKIGIKDFQVIFTLDGTESEHSAKLLQIISKENLPIIFKGKLQYDEVFQMYSKSVLIFPSYIETLGLPLLEARKHEAPIIASDMPFCVEILYGYNKAKFFKYNDYLRLSELMVNFIQFNG